jgi:hypothetical protein
MSETSFRLSAETEEATVYFETLPPMPAPRPGEDVFIPGDAYGWWRVVEVFWHLPAPRAMTPTMEVRLRVEWSPINNRPAPVYDDDQGWTQVKPGQ